MGSTKIIIDTLSKKYISDELFFLTIESNKEAYNLAISNNAYSPPFVKFLYGNLLTTDSPLLLLKLTNEEHVWWNNDVLTRLDAPNVLFEIPEVIDLLVLDGGEFTTFNDYLVLRSRTRILYLDDANVRKNRLVKKTALSDGFTLLYDNEDGNGVAVLARY